MDHENTTTNTTAPESTAPAGEATRAIDPPRAALHDLSKEDRAAFYSSGTLPEKKADSNTDAAAASSTAPGEGQTPAEIAAKDSKAASEPAAPAKDKKARNSEENRINELLEDRRRDRELHTRLQRDNDDLRKRLEALEKPKSDGKADSSTAADPSAPEWKKFRNLPGAPKLEDFTGEDALEDFVEAKAHFIAKQIAQEQVGSTLDARDKQSAEYAEAERHMQRVIDTAATRLEAEEKSDPTLRSKVDPKFHKLTPARLLPDGETAGPHHYAKDFIMFECEKPLALSVFYSTDAGRAEWRQLMTMGSKQIERAIIARELALGSSSQGEPKAAAPAAKTFTTTPPPPETAGKKPAQLGDAADKAVKKGDFAGFMREMDEREGTTSRYSRRRG